MRCDAGHCLPKVRSGGKRCLASETPRVRRVGEKIYAVTAGYGCSVFHAEALNRCVAMHYSKQDFQKKTQLNTENKKVTTSVLY